MLTKTEYLQFMSPFRELWSQRHITDVKSILGGWHGFGIRYLNDKPIFMALVEPHTNTALFKNRLLSMTRLPIEVIRTRRFRQLQTGSTIDWPNPLQPGNFVFGVDSDGTESCTGTIGPFLRFKDAKQGDPVWLLSSSHIMVPDGEKCNQETHNIILKGSQDVILSEDVRFHPLQQENNLIDAAVAQVKDPDSVRQIFTGLDIKSTEPINLTFPATVQKLGNVSHITEGQFLCICDVVDVIHCNDDGSSDFVNQILIGSEKGKKRIAEKGDSGSILISNGRPAGLLFAKTIELPTGTQQVPGIVDPFALANPFQTILDQILPLVQAEGKGRSLEMIPLTKV